jgi:hypothetical protein
LDSAPCHTDTEQQRQNAGGRFVAWNQQTELAIDGKPVIVGVNAYIHHG